MVFWLMSLSHPDEVFKHGEPALREQGLGMELDSVNAALMIGQSHDQCWIVCLPKQ